MSFKWINNITLKLKNKNSCYEQTKLLQGMTGAYTERCRDLPGIIGSFRGEGGDRSSQWHTRMCTGADRGSQGKHRG